jgi:uncharacterized OsmC-like protein
LGNAPGLVVYLDDFYFLDFCNTLRHPRSTKKKRYNIAESSTLEFTSFSCKAKGKLEKIDGKFLMSEILLEPTVVIRNEDHRNKAIRILKKAEDACLIAHSMKSKIIMEMFIQVAPLLIANN